MNIRLDDSLRIRLDASDLQKLVNGDGCLKTFRLEDSLILSIALLMAESPSYQMKSGGKELVVVLSPEELQKLSSPSHMKQGVNIGPVNLQLDIMKPSRKSPAQGGVSAGE